VEGVELAIHALPRYEPVVRLVRELGGGTLLEVGSANVGIRGYGLTEPEWRITALDRSFDNYGQAQGAPPPGCEFVVGDARQMPFADRSFDVVVALDLLEHLPPADRPPVLAEIGRVARSRAIVGCPAGAPALAADRRLPALYRRFRQPVPRWLEEHLEHGLPEPRELERDLAQFGRVRLLGNENVYAHLSVMALHVALHWTWPLRALVRALAAGVRLDGRGRRLAMHALWLLRGLDRPPAYRTIAVLDVPARRTASG
jgi:SAM-dependent methyltransferase